MLVSSDALVYGPINRALRNFSIALKLCLTPCGAKDAVQSGHHDMVIIDWGGETCVDFLHDIWALKKTKPTIIIISEEGCLVRGGHFALTKPVTDWSANEVLKTAYAHMLLDHRIPLRLPVYEPVEAKDESGNAHKLIITDTARVASV